MSQVSGIILEENKKVRHHNHRTGRFIDALCNSCNIQIRDNRPRIPVAAHNLRNYDAHHVIRNFGKRIAAKFDKNGRESYRNINVIALNLEKFISFDINRLRFIDTYQFMSASLEKLVNNVPKDSLRHTRKHLGDGVLLYAKGIFPYEWFDSMGKFDCAELPPRDAFYSKLNEEGETEE